MSKEIELVLSSTGELVDPKTTKYDQMETRIEEVETNLINLANQTSDASSKLYDLAIASQDPAYYEALAKVVMAAARANKDVISAVKAKQDITRDKDVKVSEPTVVNNTLVLTTTELLDQILNR